MAKSSRVVRASLALLSVALLVAFLSTLASAATELQAGTFASPAELLSTDSAAASSSSQLGGEVKDVPEKKFGLPEKVGIVFGVFCLFYAVTVFTLCFLVIRCCPKMHAK